MTIRAVLKKWKRWRNRLLMLIARYTIPYLYLAYMRFVWRTSKITDRMGALREGVEKPPYKAVAVLWHQDVFCVAWGYRDLKAHTLASVGDAGEIIAQILKRCNFTVLRGGSSKGKKRDKEILPELIAHMQQHHGACGITVDGSFGPAYHLKRGAIVVAKECNCPIFVNRFWCQRKILLPTWDRTVIPLPFNHLGLFSQGPYYPPSNLDDPEAFEAFRRFIENELREFAYHTTLMFDKKMPSELLDLFPPDWKPRPRG